MCSPKAVNISNVAALVDSEGKPHFTYVVEGANLFFTQQDRLYLEQCKVVLSKDPSANKGGATSPSLEVLAGLALATDEYLDLMIFKDGKPSEFYKSCVKDIQEKISENAAAESRCLWKEHARHRRASEPHLFLSQRRLRRSLHLHNTGERRPMWTAYSIRSPEFVLTRDQSPNAATDPNPPVYAAYL